MINAYLTLRVGNLDRGSFSEYDSYDLEIADYSDEHSAENINHFLNVAADPVCKYAELRLHISGHNHNGFLIGSFRQVKLKTKGSHNKYRWIVVD